MKRQLLLLGALTAFLFAAAPATAQTLYVHGGAGFPSSSAFNDFYKTGFNAGIGVGLPITSQIEGVVRGSYDRFGNDLGGSGAFSSYSGTLNLKLNGSMTNNRIHPYALAGGGIFRLGVEENFDTELGAQFGAGLGVRTSPRITLMIEPNYVLVFNEGENTQYFPVRLAAAWTL